MRSQVFFIALLAAEEEFFSPEKYGVGLFFGDITLADGVLNHLFACIPGLGNFSFGRGKGLFDHPVDNRKNNQIED
jgi:hypothetical protein